ncbi:MAG: hypothetical protein ACR2GY_01230 [Phycisphaerales bacterium]
MNYQTLFLSLIFATSVAFAPLAFAQGNPLDSSGGGGSNSNQSKDDGLPAYFKGDGLMLSIEHVDPATGIISGQLSMSGNTYPYRGEPVTGKSFAGQFDAGGEKFDFSLENQPDGRVIFTTGQSNYRLAPTKPTGQSGGGQDTPTANVAFIGDWAGSGQDVAENGQPLNFPVKISIAQSNRGSMTADFKSTVDYPVGNGQTVPVTISGQFSGSFSGGTSIELQAHEVTTQANGQSMSMGAQTLRLTIEQNATTLSGSVGNDTEGWTPIQLQRVNGPVSNINNTGGGSGGGLNQNRNSTPPDPQVILEKVELRDPGMDNMVSHTLLKPKGWTVEGGQQWNPQLYQDFVHLNLAVSSNDGRQFRVYPGGVYEDSNIYEISAEMGATQGSQRPKPGQPLMNGKTHMPLQNSVSDYVTNILIPMHRPQAQNVRVVHAEQLPALRQQIDEVLAPVIANMQQGDEQLRQMGARVQTTFNSFAERVRITYQENGQNFDEEIWVLGTVMDNANDMFQNGQIVHMYNWTVMDPRSVRAPAGQLDAARPLIDAVSLSLQENPRYSAILMDIRARINKQEMDALIKRGEIARKGREDAWDIYQSGVQSKQASDERLHDSFNDMIQDIDKFHDTDGSSVRLPSLYSNVYSNGEGGYLLTNDPVLNPDDVTNQRWERINPAR